LLPKDHATQNDTKFDPSLKFDSESQNFNRIQIHGQTRKKGVGDIDNIFQWLL